MNTNITNITSLIFIIVTIVIFVLLLLNFIFAPHKPYKEKDSPFECGFHSFKGQSRTQFNISFFVFALLFIVFDLEIAFIYPFLPTFGINEAFGLIVFISFVVLLTVGFSFEYGKKALNIISRQSINNNNADMR